MIGKEIYSVYQINQKVKQIIEFNLPNQIWIKGEISDFDKRAKSKNIYFELQEKDKTGEKILSKIPCILFESNKALIRSRLIEGKIIGKDNKGMDGLEVCFKVSLNVYVPGGNYSLVIRDLDPMFTLGKLDQHREQIRKNLKEKGLLNLNCEKNKLPLVPLKIGLITQKDSEGYHDFLKRLEEEKIAFKVYFYQSSVQGKKMEGEIISGLKYFSEHRSSIDVVVITRGGGSKSDLRWFDNQKIAESIAFMPLPVITGIGHKTDVSIADMVAYLSQSTPSLIAEFLVKRVNDFLQNIQEKSTSISFITGEKIRFQEQKINHFLENFKNETKNRLQLTSQRFHYLINNIVHQSNHWLKSLQERINTLQLNVPQVSCQVIKKAKEKTARYKMQLNILDPQNIFKRGFSICQINGKLVKSIKAVKLNQELTTVLFDGEIKSKIKDVSKK